MKPSDYLPNCGGEAGETVEALGGVECFLVGLRITCNVAAVIQIL